jgi:hypothetical protein
MSREIDSLAHLVNDVLQSEGPWIASSSDETICRRLVEDLTQEDQETAARTSYAYWVASSSDDQHACPSDETRIQMAMREARRHLVGEGGQEDKALLSLRAACSFRKVSECEPDFCFSGSWPILSYIS